MSTENIPKSDNSIDRKLISIVIPVFNEEENVCAIYNSICETMSTLEDKYEYEILFLDNHSTDNSFLKLKAIANKDARVKVIRYVRNFGIQRSILSGYRLANGNAAIVMDCDLQDPPYLINNFIELWEKGHDVVVGVCKKRKEGKLITSMRRLYYRALDTLSEDPLPHDAGDFRLVDRQILDKLDKIDDARPYVRGLISTLASREIGVPFDRDLRAKGESKFPVRRLIPFALDGIFSHSIIPLRVASCIGFVVSLFTILLSLWYISRKLLYGGDWPSGFATLSVLLLFGIGMNGLFLGIIGEYIGRIYRQIRTRPTIIIQETINIADENIIKAERLR